MPDATASRPPTGSRDAKLAAIERIEETVRGQLTESASRKLAAYLFELLKHAADGDRWISQQLTRESACIKIGAGSIRSGTFKRAVVRLRETLGECRPEDDGLLPPALDRAGLACIEATIDGRRSLVIVRGPTSKDRDSTPDGLLRLEALFRPIEAMTLLHPPVMQRFWVDRPHVRAALDTWWFSGREPILAITGVGGTGKSTVVHRWLNLTFSSLDLSKDAAEVLQFSFYEHGNKTFRDFLVAIRGRFNLSSSDPADIESVVRVLERRPLLLVLDGVERLLREYAVAAPDLVEESDSHRVPDLAREIADVDAWRFFTMLLSRRLKARILVISRLLPADFDDARACTEIEVKGLTDAQSIAVLRHFRIEGTDVELRDEAKLVGGHPLTLARLATLLRDDRIAPRNIRRAPQLGKHISLRRRRHDIFVWSFNVLAASDKALLLVVAAARGVVNRDDLVSLARSARLYVSPATLRQLHGDMWIDADESDNIRIHPVARRWLAEQDRSPQQTHEHHVALWRDRASQISLDAARINDTSAIAPHLELIFHLIRAGQYLEAWEKIDDKLSGLLDRLSEHAVRLRLLLEFFPDVDERLEPFLTDAAAQGSLLNSLGNDLSNLGEPIRALPVLERAANLASSPPSFATRIGNLALTQIRVGRLRDADTAINSQRDAALRCGDKVNLLVAIQEQARLCAIRGQFREAEELLRSAESVIDEIAHFDDDSFEVLSPIGWDVQRKRNYVVGRRATQGVMYRAYTLLLRGADAVAVAERAASEAESNGVPRQVAFARCWLGHALAARRVDTRAREILHDVLNLVESKRLGDVIADVLTGIAKSWVDIDNQVASDFAYRAELEARRGRNALQLADALLTRALASGNEKRRHLAAEAREAARCDGAPYAYDVVMRATEALL